MQEFKSLKKVSKKYDEIKKVDLSLLNSKCELFQNFSNSSNYASELAAYSLHPTTVKPDTYIQNASTFTSNANNFIPSNLTNHNLSYSKIKKIENSRFQEIYSFMTNEPISINTLCKKTSKSISEVSSILFFLELEGYIRKIEGGYICILNK